MPNAPLSTTVARVRRAVRPPDSPTTDGRLLARFARDRDDDAFAELVRRLGPLVLGACRRVTGDPHLAEDAFQAAFVVLARRAADVRPAGAVRGWLYGVAVRCAKEARALHARRRSREIPVPVLPESPAMTAERPDADALDALDEAIARLPDHLRAAVVLCELDGVSRTDAAVRLGIAEGTLSSRLAKARKVLAEDLRRRGVALSAIGLSVIPVSPVLAASTAARATGSAALPPSVTTLVHGVMRTMFFQKLKLVAPVLGLIALGVFAAGVPAANPGVHTPGTPKPGPVVRTAGRQPAPKPPGPNKIIVWNETKHLFLTPDGNEVGTLPRHPDNRIVNEPVLSPDGKFVAFTANDDPPTDDQGHMRRTIFVRSTDGQGDGKTIAVNAMNLCWTADGKALIAAEYAPVMEAVASGFPHWRIDPTTGEKKKLDVPKLTHVFAATPDGTGFIASIYDLEKIAVHLALVSDDGKTVTKLTEVRTEGPNPRVSPDGTKILFQDIDRDEKLEKDMPRLHRLYVFDLKAKKRERLAEVPLNAHVMGYCWSPDGKKVAYTWKQVQPGVPLAFNTENFNDPKLRTETESHLVVADADGKNPKTILSNKAPTAPSITIGTVDWR